MRRGKLIAILAGVSMALLFFGSNAVATTPQLGVMSHSLGQRHSRDTLGTDSQDCRFGLKAKAASGRRRNDEKAFDQRHPQAGGLALLVNERGAIDPTATIGIDVLIGM